MSAAPAERLRPTRISKASREARHLLRVRRRRPEFRLPARREQRVADARGDRGERAEPRRLRHKVASRQFLVRHVSSLQFRSHSGYRHWGQRQAFRQKKRRGARALAAPSPRSFLPCRSLVQLEHQTEVQRRATRADVAVSRHRRAEEPASAGASDEVNPAAIVAV